MKTQTYGFTQDSTLMAFEGPVEPKLVALNQALSNRKEVLDSLRIYDEWKDDIMYVYCKSALPVVNAHPVTDSWFITTEAGTQAHEVKPKPGETVALPGWKLEKVPCYECPGTHTCPSDCNPIPCKYPRAYRLVRSEPVKQRACREICGDAACIHEGCAFIRNESPVEPKTQEHCPKCRTTDFKSCHSMYCPVRVETHISSTRPIEELFVEEYFGIRGSGDGPEINSDFGHLVGLLTSFKEKFITPESHKTQESQEELWLEAMRIYARRDHTADGRVDLINKFTITRK